MLFQSRPLPAACSDRPRHSKSILFKRNLNKKRYFFSPGRSRPLKEVLSLCARAVCKASRVLFLLPTRICFFFLFNDTLFISFLIRFERLDTLPGYRLQRHCPTSNYYLRRRKSGRQSPLPGVRIQRRCPWRHRIAGIAS